MTAPQEHTAKPPPRLSGLLAFGTFLFLVRAYFDIVSALSFDKPLDNFNFSAWFGNPESGSLLAFLCFGALAAWLLASALLR